MQWVLGQVKGSRLKRVVFAGSSSVYGDAEAFPTRASALPRPVSPYGVTKLAAEHLAHLYTRNFDIPAVSVRYFTVYGPRQRPDMAFSRFLQALAAGAPTEVFRHGARTPRSTSLSDPLTPPTPPPAPSP